MLNGRSTPLFRENLLFAKRSLAVAGCVGLVAVCWMAIAGTAAEKEDAPPAAKAAAKHPFDKNVKVTFTDDLMIVESDGIPTHKTGDFPNRDNPNRIVKQNYKFKIPLRPRVADLLTPTPMGPIGVAINGIPFYNQKNREGHDAVKLEVFDSCCGHPDPMGRYHDHKATGRK